MSGFATFDIIILMQLRSSSWALMFLVNVWGRPGVEVVKLNITFQGEGYQQSGQKLHVQTFLHNKK